MPKIGKYKFIKSKIGVGGFGGGVLKPYMDGLLQWIINKTPEYNSSTGYWEFSDKVGTREGLIQEGKAYLFDGVDDVVTVPGVDLSNKTKFSIKAEMSKQAGESISLEKFIDLPNRLSLVWFSDGNAYVIMCNGSNDSFGQVAFTDYGKHDFEMRFDGTGATNSDRLKLFIDGVEQTLNYNGTVATSSADFTGVDLVVGKVNGANASDAKIAKIEIIDNDNLTHRYNCDEGAGDKMFDSVEKWEEVNYDSDFSSSTDGWTIINDGGTDSTINNANNNLIVDVATGGQLLRPTLGKFFTLNKGKKRLTVSGQSGIIGGIYDGVSFIDTPNHDLATQGTFEYEFELTIDNPALFIYMDTTAGAQQVVISDIKTYAVYEPADGTIENANLATFHTEDNSFTSSQNELGYSIQDDGHTLPDYEAGVFYPIKVDNEGKSTNEDIYGNTPTYNGRVKYNARAVESNCVEFDGIDDAVVTSMKLSSGGFNITVRVDTDNSLTNNSYLCSDWNGTGMLLGIGSTNALIVFTNSTIISIPNYFNNDKGIRTITLSYDGSGNWNLSDNIEGELGTATGNIPDFDNGTTFIIGNRADYFRPFKGKLFSLTVDDHEYNFATGNGNTIYDKNPNNPINGTITNANLITFWTTDNQRPHNLLDGFDLWQNDTTSEYLRIPFDINGNPIKTNGDTIAGYTWISNNLANKGHNNAETKIQQYTSPAMILADKPQLYWFDASEVAQKISYADLVADVYTLDEQHITFCDVSKDRFENLPQKFNSLTYETALSGEILGRVYKFINNNIWDDNLIWDDDNIWYD